MIRLLLALGLLFFGQMALAQCDTLFVEPEFGVENTWMPKTKSYVLEVSFKESCVGRSSCYLASGSIRNRCDEKYHEDLTKVCKAKYQYKDRLFGQCMKKVNTAAKLVKLEGAQYFRSQKRKAGLAEREADRKLRADKRRESSSQRAEERRKKRLNR